MIYKYDKYFLGYFTTITLFQNLDGTNNMKINRYMYFKKSQILTFYLFCFEFQRNRNY